MGHDLRFALRTLRRTPGLTAVASVILALGIGGTTAMFSVVDRLLLGDLTYPDSRLVTLLAAMGFVLLMTCVSVASLLLARASVRRTEMAVRSAIGASRSRLVRQLLIESVVLASLSGVAGLVVALWGIDALVALLPSNPVSLDTIRLDVRLLTVAAVVTLTTGVASAILPAAFATRRAAGPQPTSILRSY